MATPLILAQKPTNVDKRDFRKSERVTHLLKLLKPNTQITSYLDIGCGNAEVTAQITKEYKIHQTYGVDVYDASDFKAIDDTTINYKQVIDSKIDVPDNSIDLITCFMSIHHFVNFSTMMKEMIRVLKPGGFLFFREHDVPESNKKLKSFLDKKHEEYPDHPGGIINYWSRPKLKYYFVNNCAFKHIGDSDYPARNPNPQAIYHSLYKLHSK